MENFIIAIMVVILIIAFCYYENNWLKTTKLKVKLNTKNKIKIVQLSDLHSKNFGKDNKVLENKIRKLNPDLILETGDIIDSNLKNLDNILDFIIRLNKSIKVVYIPGNNENRCKKLEYIIDTLKENGVIALRNEITDINIKGEEINILGLAENIKGKRETGFKRIKETYHHHATEGLFKEFEKRKGLKLVLSHYPEKFKGDGRYCDYNFHLMFSGHAHGGQFILPFVGGLFAPGQGILPKYYGGMYDGEHNKLIVSRGLGNSGFPLRLFNRPDVVYLEIYN